MIPCLSAACHDHHKSKRQQFVGAADAGSECIQFTLETLLHAESQNVILHHNRAISHLGPLQNNDVVRALCADQL